MFLHGSTYIADHTCIRYWCLKCYFCVETFWQFLGLLVICLIRCSYDRMVIPFDLQAIQKPKFYLSRPNYKNESRVYALGLSRQALLSYRNTPEHFKIRCFFVIAGNPWVCDNPALRQMTLVSQKGQTNSYSRKRWLLIRQYYRLNYMCACTTTNAPVKSLT